MKTLAVELQSIEGIPLLMTTWFGIDPDNPMSKLLKELLSVPTKKRTDEHRLKIRETEWRMNLYHGNGIGPYMPAENLEAMLIAGAKKSRKGELFKASIIVDPPQIPLLYDGPRGIEEMFEDPRFVDIRPARLGGFGKPMGMKVRPCFPEWTLAFRVMFSEDRLDSSDIENALKAGAISGLGSFRPRFGRFEVTKCEPE